MNTFNRMNGGWIRCALSVGLVLAAGSAQALAPGDYVPLKPKQVPGDTSIPLPVDPARCSKGDKKYIYWAAKEQVFRLRFDPDLPVYAIPDRDLSGSLQARQEIPPPPDPKEPEGCYGNPLRGLSMPYFEQFTARVYQDLRDDHRAFLVCTAAVMRLPGKPSLGRAFGQALISERFRLDPTAVPDLQA